jgi:hypothetical protein
MRKSKLSKIISGKIGRSFAIMYNRASMYKIDHPFTSKSIQELFSTVTEGLDLFSPVALILNREQFFIEEEPFDQRLNTSRMAAHFKKIGVQSISFEKGVKKSELKNFVKVFVGPKSYPKASLMKKALADKQVLNVKINHVFYKKMTADDQIVKKEKINHASGNINNSSSNEMFGEVLNMMAESVLIEEIEKSFSLKDLLEDPIKISNDLISRDADAAKEKQTDSPQNGSFISNQLGRIREQVAKLEKGVDEVDLSTLADAVFEMRDALIKGIETQKNSGILYENEQQIIDEATALTDQVLIQLIKEEYHGGKISTERLAQILRRMVPEPADLKRLMPLLKQALIAEGMQISEFMSLIDVLGKELHNEDLLKIFGKGANEIGLSSENLIQELKKDPSNAAELIYLASELRNGTGDDKILTDLLVDYIERIGSKIVLDTTDLNDGKKDNHIKKVIANIESEIVGRLDKKGIDHDVLNSVQEKLMERMEMCFNKLKKEWESRQILNSSAIANDQTTVFKILEESVVDGDELHNILAQVRTIIENGEIDENNIQQITKEITRISKNKQTQKTIELLPKGILPYNTTQFFIEKEIFRSNRYETPFSVITFSTVKVDSKQPIPNVKLVRQSINQFVMNVLVRTLRDADLIGILSKQVLTVILPMTEKENAKIVMRRILRSLHESSIKVNNLNLKVQLAGMVTSFDGDQSPDLKSFLSIVENNHDELIIRLQNIRDLY